MIIFANLLGRLNTDAIPTNIITVGGVLSMLGALMAIVALITYKRKWKWLYKNWLTSLDPKKMRL
jgi:cytochrome o ubiquinol oxidase subunit 1